MKSSHVTINIVYIKYVKLSEYGFCMTSDMLGSAFDSKKIAKALF
jgi:hypothetical protein